MAHALLTLIFVAIASIWLVQEIRPQERPVYRWGWVAAAVAAQLFASIIAIAYGGKAGNFLLHAIGGGVASTLLFFYFTRAFKVRLPWRLQLACLCMFVSTLGVLNELAEYLYELAGMGIMSFDTHDSWRDFVANTAGALIAYGAVRLGLWRAGRKRRSS